MATTDEAYANGQEDMRRAVAKVYARNVQALTAVCNDATQTLAYLQATYTGEELDATLATWGEQFGMALGVWGELLSKELRALEPPHPPKTVYH